VRRGLTIAALVKEGRHEPASERAPTRGRARTHAARDGGHSYRRGGPSFGGLGAGRPSSGSDACFSGIGRSRGSARFRTATPFSPPHPKLPARGRSLGRVDLRSAAWRGQIPRCAGFLRDPTQSSSSSRPVTWVRTSRRGRRGPRWWSSGCPVPERRVTPRGAAWRRTPADSWATALAQRAWQIFDGAADLGLRRHVGLLRCGFSIDGSLLCSDLPALTGFEHDP
jgi:hypothetical protein